MTTIPPPVPYVSTSDYFKSLASSSNYPVETAAAKRAVSGADGSLGAP